MIEHRFTVKPVTPIRWEEPPRRPWHKRLVAKLLRLPKPAPIPVYPEGTRAVLLDFSEGERTHRVYFPHAAVERAW